MAIELGFISVVLRKSALRAISPENCRTVRELFRWHRDWFREDDDLLATSFMAPSNTRAFCLALEDRWTLMRETDWAVVDMSEGLCFPVDWLNIQPRAGSIPVGVWLKDHHPGPLARIPLLIPGPRQEVTCIFNRDSPMRDAPAQLDDPGAKPHPKWGGTHVWLHAAPDAPYPSPDGKQPPMVFRDSSHIDFMTWNPAPAEPSQEADQASLEVEGDLKSPVTQAIDGSGTGHFRLLLESTQQFISNVEMIATMQVEPLRDYGPVYADGIDGYSYNIAIAAFEEPVRFKDRQSALNAIHYLQKDMEVTAASFQILHFEN